MHHLSLYTIASSERTFCDGLRGVLLGSSVCLLDGGVAGSDDIVSSSLYEPCSEDFESFALFTQNSFMSWRHRLNVLKYTSGPP